MGSTSERQSKSPLPRIDRADSRTMTGLDTMAVVVGVEELKGACQWEDCGCFRAKEVPLRWQALHPL